MQTVTFSFMISNSICMIVIGILWRQYHRQYAGFGYWLAAYVLQLIALVLLALKGIAPDLLTITASNGLVLAGTILFYIGLERFTGKRTPQLHNFILLAAFIPAHASLTFILGSHTLREILFSLALLAVSIQCVWLLLRVPAEMQVITRAVRYAFTAFCMVNLVSVGYELAVPAKDYLERAEAFDTLLLFTYQVLLMVLAFTLVLMVNRRLLADLNRDMTARQQAEAALILSEEKFHKAFQSSPDGIVISRLRDGRYVDVNDGFCRMMGYTRDEMLTSSSISQGLWANPSDRKKVIAEIQNNGSIRDYEYDFRTRSGATIHTSFSSQLIELGGEHHILSIIQDITERKRAEKIIHLRLKLWEFAPLHSFEELMQLALDGIEDLTGSLIGFYHFVEADQNMLSLQAWSTRTKAVFCVAEGQGMHYPIQEAGVWVDCVREARPVIHNDYASLPHRKGMPPGHAQVIREVVVPTMREGRVVAILGVGNKPSDYDQQDVELVDFIADVVWSIVEQRRADAEIRQLNTRLEFLAMTDDLTGLTNRRSFITQGIKEIHRAQRSQTPFSLYMLDLDGFKTINDRDGHEAGDRALQAIAAVLLENVRQTDLLARLGGDEFSVLLPDTRPEHALVLAERLRMAVESVRGIDHDQKLNVTASIGVSSYCLDDASFYEVVRRADTAMYQAKNQGGNRVICGD
jgi:diguanylate cyclase (GGDEF)-like protein/PAS domain S-box-containing protein